VVAGKKNFSIILNVETTNVGL